MNEQQARIQFLASEAGGAKFALRLAWPGGPHVQQTTGLVFYRPASQSGNRIAAYCLAAYRGLAAYVALVRTFDEALAALRTCGYQGGTWAALDHEIEHYTAPMDHRAIWTAGYGLVRSSNADELARLVLLPDMDEQAPF